MSSIYIIYALSKSIRCCIRYDDTCRILTFIVFRAFYLRELCLFTRLGLLSSDPNCRTQINAAYPSVYSTLFNSCEANSLITTRRRSILIYEVVINQAHPATVQTWQFCSVHKTMSTSQYRIDYSTCSKCSIWELLTKMKFPSPPIKFFMVILVALHASDYVDTIYSEKVSKCKNQKTV